MINWIARKAGFVRLIEVEDRLHTAHQALLEITRAYEVGPSWFTKGRNGMIQHVDMWARRGLEATRPLTKEGLDK